MDRKDFRQIDQRYIAAKALEGASLDNIASNVYNPVEEMKTITGPNNTLAKPTTGSDTQKASSVFWLILIIFIVILAIAGTVVK